MNVGAYTHLRSCESRHLLKDSKHGGGVEGASMRERPQTGRLYARSKTAAMPWPPPMHIVSRPMWASRRCISCSSVAMIRPPVAPIG